MFLTWFFDDWLERPAQRRNADAKISKHERSTKYFDGDEFVTEARDQVNDSATNPSNYAFFLRDLQKC